MKLLVGLGNPGAKHLLDRHNMGFIAVDLWLRDKGLEATKKEYNALTARTEHAGQEVLVMKPQTYMNKSGESILAAMNFFKIPIEDVIVVHDELDIPPSSFRVKRGGGAGGHNGLKSILQLGDAFIRVRLGIGRPLDSRVDIADYVLGRLSTEEQAFWQENMVDVLDAIDLCLEAKVDLAMNRFNRRAESDSKEKA